MVELVVQVPEDVAERLAPLGRRLPELLEQIADVFPLQTPRNGGPITTAPVYIEILDFLVNSPTFEAMIAYKVSDATQERLRELLDKNRESQLTAAEEAELDTYEYVDQLLTLLKARAHEQLHAGKHE